MDDESRQRPASQVAERMQALLSRAVEDQVSEQRAASAVLTDVRGQLVALSEGVRLAASGASVEKLVDSVGTILADVRAATVLLDQRLATLTERSDTLVARFGAVEERLGHVERRLSETEQATSGANHESEQRITAHVDESVLALAEALLRRGRVTRDVATPAAAEPAPAPAPALAPPAAQVAPPAGRAAVTSSLAPAPERSPRPPTRDPSATGAVQPKDVDPDESERRRPWWLPGS